MRTYLALSFALVVPACLASDPAESDTEQDVTWSNLSAVQTCTDTGPFIKTCTYPLGNVGTDRVCMLAGVGGDLSNSSASIITTKGTPRSPSQYQLQISTGTTASAQAVCVEPYQSSMTTGTWNNHQLSDTFLGNTTGMQCFLSGITSSYGFAAANDTAWVRKLPTGWYITGNAATSNAYVTVSATCFVPTGTDGTVPYYFLSPGTYNLAKNTDNVACGLQEVTGGFSAGDLVSMNYVSPWWQTTIAGNHKMEATCFH